MTYPDATGNVSFPPASGGAHDRFQYANQKTYLNEKLTRDRLFN